MNRYPNHSTYNGYGVRTPAGAGQPAPARTPLAPAVRQALGQDVPPEQLRQPEYDADRVVVAGGELGSQILTQEYQIFERLYRSEPEEGMFDPSVSPNNPFEFSMGAFQVPPNMSLLLFNLRPDIYRFSGVDPGDFVPVEARRFGSIMGFELKVAEQHVGDVDFQIDPVAIQRTSSQAYQSTNLTATANQGQFARAAAGVLAVAQGSSKMLLPQRPTRYGAPDPIPFTIFVSAGQVVEARCSIFRPVPTPIAFVEFDLSGVLVPTNYMTDLSRAVSPPHIQGGERIK